jgi:hypothetical protein
MCLNNYMIMFFNVFYLLSAALYKPIIEFHRGAVPLMLQDVSLSCQTNQNLSQDNPS